MHPHHPADPLHNIVLTTKLGTITIRPRVDISPITVAMVTALAAHPHFDYGSFIRNEPIPEVRFEPCFCARAGVCGKAADRGAAGVRGGQEGGRRGEVKVEKDKNAVGGAKGRMGTQVAGFIEPKRGSFMVQASGFEAAMLLLGVCIAP